MSQKVMRMLEVCLKVGLSRSKIYELINEQLFPKPIQLTKRTVGFIESEIDEWIQKRINERDSQNAA